MNDEPKVVSYGSYEEMLEDMRKGEERANAAVLPPQKGIDFGDYFIRVYDGHLQIFGYVYTPSEIVEMEKSAGASEREAQDYLVVVRDAHERGYRKGQCYSQVEPEGELGSTHIVNCWPITEEDFEYAEDHRWTLSATATARIQNEIEEAVRDHGQSFGV